MNTTHDAFMDMPQTATERWRSGAAMPLAGYPAEACVIRLSNRFWNVIAAAYAVYGAIFLAGERLGIRELNKVGGMILILGFLLGSLPSLRRARPSGAFIAAVAAAILPILTAALSAEPADAEALVKYVAVALLMAFAILAPPQSPPGGRPRLVFAGVVLLLIVVSFAAGHSIVAGGEVRNAGVFANPNNLALMAFLFPLLIDEQRDNRLKQAAAYAVSFGVVVASRTSGALIAFCAGMVGAARRGLRRSPQAVIVCAAFCASLVSTAALAGLLDPLQSSLAGSRVGSQFRLAYDNLFQLKDPAGISFYKLQTAYGQGTSSGLWRLWHWQKLLSTYFDGSFIQWLFGFGAGSAMRLLGNMPHNDYLRFLFEQGLIGFALNVGVWTVLFRRASVSAKRAMVMVAVYCFTENNIDNFLFMSLFVLVSTAEANPARPVCVLAAHRPSAPEMAL